MKSAPLGSLLACALVLGACGKRMEGDDAGECTDGADNDRDGYFDCQDNDCWNSPDCDGVGTTGDGGSADHGGDGGGAGGDGGNGGGGDGGDSDGGGTDGGGTDGGGTDGGGTDGGGTDGGTTDPLFATLDSYSLTMKVDWYFNPIVGLTDCTLEYAGSGSREDTGPDLVWFYGPYDQTSTTCTDHDIIASGFPWYDATSGEAWVGFVFDDSRKSLDEWFADDRQASGGYEADWWMYDMSATFYEESGYISHFESYSDSSGYFTVAYDIEIIFNP